MAAKKSTFNPDFKSPPKIINQEVEKDVFLERIRNHPDNARKGDIAEIAQSILENGFYGHLIVQRSTGYILAGNHRFLAGIQCGMYHFPVCWVDVTDEEALRLVAVDNATSDRAEYHKEKQAAMLAKLASMGEKGLKGSGYNEGHLDALNDQLIKAREKAAASAEKKGKKGDGDDRWAIVILCEGPEEQQTRFDELDELGLRPRRTILNERTKLALG